jgi:hypothetical protein
MPMPSVPAFPTTHILDEIAQALEDRQDAASVTISISSSSAPDDRSEFRIEGQDIGQMAHTLRRAVAREEAT